MKRDDVNIYRTLRDSFDYIPFCKNDAVMIKYDKHHDRAYCVSRCSQHAWLYFVYQEDASNKEILCNNFIPLFLDCSVYFTANINQILVLLCDIWNKTDEFYEYSIKEYCNYLESRYLSTARLSHV